MISKKVFLLVINSSLNTKLSDQLEDLSPSWHEIDIENRQGPVEIENNRTVLLEIDSSPLRHVILLSKPRLWNSWKMGKQN